jgi:PGM1 C-terminal domain
MWRVAEPWQPNVFWSPDPNATGRLPYDASELSEVAVMTQARPDAFDRLQAKLGPALGANRQGSTTDHVLVVLPSYSVSESILSHYRDRVFSLEHRYLNGLLVAARIPACEVIYVSSRPPAPEILGYYTSLMRDDMQEDARFDVLDVDDGTLNPVACKLSDNREQLDAIRALVRGRPALIEAWNVTEHETRLALALDIPINGTRPDLRHLGYKSAGRRLFREAGVPVPVGLEDVRTVDDVIEAVGEIRDRRPGVEAVVIKHDDSGAGDGNQVIDLRPMDAAADARMWLRATPQTLPEWYLTDLRAGGVVEERVTGTRFSSPSAQFDIRPDGSVQVLSTHEQVLGGADAQVYLGCRFPADPAYAPVLATYAQAIGVRLAQAGALGRVAVDFVAATDASGAWRVHAIEINLRKGGTTHPYAAMRNLIPGRYDTAHGAWVAYEDGSARCYGATDNLVDPLWLGLEPTRVIESVRDAGLLFTHETHTGAVLHMLSGLAIDGRMGMTAIGRTIGEALAIQRGVEGVMDRICQLPGRPPV